MSEARNLRFTLNGRTVSAAIQPHLTLVELLHGLGLFGARESCGQGLCGCCTVLVDDVAVSGCLYLAVGVDGKSVTTVEHLDSGGRCLRSSRPSSKPAPSNAASARPASC